MTFRSDLEQLLHDARRAPDSAYKDGFVTALEEVFDLLDDCSIEEVADLIEEWDE